MTTFCPKHFTLEDVDCAEPIVACPPRVELDPARHVIVSCGPCNRVRVVPVERIMKGKVQSAGMCQLDVCAGTVISPVTAAAPLTLEEFVEAAQANGFTSRARTAALIEAARQEEQRNAVPEGCVVVTIDHLEGLKEKARRYDDLNDEPQGDTGTVSGNNPGHDPDSGQPAPPLPDLGTVAAGIEQAAPSKAAKGNATSRKPGK